MSEEEISALAREYAEEACPIESYKDDIVERNMDLRIAKDEAKTLLRWLTRRYCIVEKEGIKDMYRSAKTVFDHPRCAEAKAYAMCRLNILETLFPDLGKEVEE